MNSGEAATADGRTVTYVYAVARDTAGLSEAAAALSGVAGAPVRLLPGRAGDGIVFVASPVSARDFGAEALRQHLEDLEWLEAVARAHHEVIEALAASTTVLPLRLATVYLDDDRAGEVLDSDGASFVRLLERLEGHVEWGVKIYVETPARAAPAPAPSGSGEPGSGRAYLRGLRSQRTVRDSAHRSAGIAAERVVAAGRRLAAERAQHRVQQGELAGSRGENVVNDAYLLEHARADAFREEVEHAADDLPGVRIEVTGPWVPYSFSAPASLGTPAGGEAAGDAAEGERR